MNRAFVQLSIILVAGVTIIVSFFSGEQLVLGIGGVVYAVAALLLLRNLVHDPVFKTGDKS